MRRALAALTLAGLTAACGTTVPITSQTAVGSDGLGGSGLSGTSGSTTTGGTSTGVGSTTGLGGPAGTSGSLSGGSSTGGSTSVAGGTGPGSGTTGSAPVSGGGSIPTSGPGWDAKHVYIGVTTQKDANQAFGSAGVNGVDGGDQEGDANAVVAYLNSQGGLFGRQIVPVFHDLSTVSTAQNPDAAGAATCSYYSSDKRVIALLSPVTLMDVDSFRSCMAQKRIPLFAASVAAVTQSIAQRYAPYFYQSIAPTWDALAPAFVSELKSEGYFSTAWDTTSGSSRPGRATVGVIGDSTSGGSASVAVLSKALAAAGYSAKTFIYDSRNNSTLSSAVLQFRSDGVDHVIGVDSGLLPFQLQASSQNYRPRYGVNSLNAPVTYLQLNGGSNQNLGAIGAGWAPSLDVDDSNDPGIINNGQALCNGIFAKAKQNLTGKRLARAVAYAFCDGLRLIAGGALAGNGLTGQDIYAGMLRIGPGFASAFSFAPGLQPRRLFIPGGVRPLAFVSSCQCFRYTSKATTRL